MLPRARPHRAPTAPCRRGYRGAAGKWGKEGRGGTHWGWGFGGPYGHVCSCLLAAAHSILHAAAFCCVLLRPQSCTRLHGAVCAGLCTVLPCAFARSLLQASAYIRTPLHSPAFSCTLLRSRSCTLLHFAACFHSSPPLHTPICDPPPPPPSPRCRQGEVGGLHPPSARSPPLWGRSTWAQPPARARSFCCCQQNFPTAALATQGRGAAEEPPRSALPVWGVEGGGGE